MARAESSPSDLLKDLRDLLVAYARQETLDPLRALGRYLAFGLAGSSAMAIGSIFIVVGLLRLLQDGTGGAFDGAWSFAPYLIVVVVVLGAIVALGAVVARSRSENLGSR